ncbi:hypothetical protein V8F20_011685 [Naviculisporaceae sp. PSN 640]
MAPLLRALSVAILGLLGATNVLAGSAIWETKLNHARRVVAHEPVPVDSAGYAINEEHAAVNTIKKRSQHRKRWIAEREYEGNRGGRWPDRTVLYCWETMGGKILMDRYLREALKLWDAAGLRKDRYIWEEVAQPGTACTQHPNRANHLVIMYDAEKKYLNWFGGNSATVGLDPNGRSNLKIGHSYHFAQTAGLIAHEVGHVWGLDHEMTHPGYWSEPYNEDFPGTVFGDNFFCENIIGYEKAVARAEANDETAERLCRYPEVASFYDFDASEYLPFTVGYVSSHPVGVGLGYTDVDWHSVMMYGTYVSSKSMPLKTLPVLKRTDGQEIFDYYRPSPGDVHGVRHIYDEPHDEIEQAPFPGLPNAGPDVDAGFWNSKKDRYKQHIMQALSCGSA